MEAIPKQALTGFMLFCPDCKEHTDHRVTSWETADGVRGVVSLFCQKCARTVLAELSSLPLANIADPVIRKTG
jgi:hypothetical protein